MLFRRSYFLIDIDKTINKRPSKLCFGELCQLHWSQIGCQIFGLVINRVGGFGKWATHPYQIFLGVPLGYSEVVHK